ncbi:pre-rRNA processing protein [Exophiala xenobiotica]|nr:pre-rRNA processing protein [Exophiala xenobiotica]
MSGVAFKKSSAGTRRGEQYIRQEDEDDEPLDLLDPKSMGNISSRKLGRLRDAQASSRKTKAKVNEDGKLVFGGNDNDNEADEDVDVAMSGGAGQDNSINAYLDAVSGADAVRRGQKGKLKVKSGMQKKTKQETRQRDGEMDLDVEEAREVARQIMQGSGSPRLHDIGLLIDHTLGIADLFPFRDLSTS